MFGASSPSSDGEGGPVLDLPHPADGKPETAYEIPPRLTDRPFPAVRWRTPQYRAVFRAWNLGDSATSWYGPEVGTVAPRADRPPYGGPIAGPASSAPARGAGEFVGPFPAPGRGRDVGGAAGRGPRGASPLALAES